VLERGDGGEATGELCLHAQCLHSSFFLTARFAHRSCHPGGACAALPSTYPRLGLAERPSDFRTTPGAAGPMDRTKAIDALGIDRCNCGYTTIREDQSVPNGPITLPEASLPR